MLIRIFIIKERAVLASRGGAMNILGFPTRGEAVQRLHSLHKFSWLFHRDKFDAPDFQVNKATITNRTETWKARHIRPEARTPSPRRHQRPAYEPSKTLRCRRMLGSSGSILLLREAAGVPVFIIQYQHTKMVLSKHYRPGFPATCEAGCGTGGCGTTLSLSTHTSMDAIPHFLVL